MSFSDIILPRQDILKKDAIDGIIDIENLNDPKKLSVESRPDDFFELTYPTADVKLVIDNVHKRFNSATKSAGLFLFEGYKGSGKSHLELLVYHLFKNPAIAAGWLSKHGMECRLPQDTIVVINKMTDFPLDSLWYFLFQKLGCESVVDPKIPPNLRELQSALSGRKLVLILDELEMGVQSIVNEHTRKQNIGFLQQLSEEASRTLNTSITLFASIYDSNTEPGETLKRVPRIEVKFSQPMDRQHVVLHRLFSNAHAIDRSRVDAIVASYANLWKKIGFPADERYLERCKQSYPFSPEIVDMLLYRALRQNFQGHRGPLGLLAEVVRTMHRKTDLITAAHLDITNIEIVNRLLDLDPGQQILQCAQGDLRDLRERTHSLEIISSVLTATLTSVGFQRGIAEAELHHQVLKPGDDYNVYRATLQAFEKFGTYFQHAEGNYFFDTEEKPYAKVEYGALRVDANDARELALNRWKVNVFADPNAVLYRDPVQVRAELSRLDKSSLRYVLAPHRLEDADRKHVYHGAEIRNQIILLEPRADTFNAVENPDLIKWAQLARSASDLMTTAADMERKRQYEKICTENLRYIDDAFKKAGLYYVLMHMEQEPEQTLRFELEPLAQAVNRQEVFTRLKQDVFPRQRIVDHLSECIESEQLRASILDHTVSDIRRLYKTTLGFPVFTAETIVTEALTQLCKDKHIGLKSGRGNFCGDHPSFSGTEWDDVLITEPFVKTGTQNVGMFPPANSSESTGTPTNDIDTNPAPVPPVSTAAEFVIQTTNEDSKNNLRQKLALKLDEVSEPAVTWIRFTVFVHYTNADLGVLPAAFRGSLSGTADMSAEIVLEKRGQFSKAQVEQLTEQLPAIAQASYKAEAKGVEQSDTNNGH